MDLHAPDGSNQPVNTQTVQQIGTLRAFSTAIILARASAAWEQAGVIYINDVRQQQLIGNYHHPGQFGVGEKPFDQVIAVAGWHKRSGPDGGQPWHASFGILRDGIGCWDDSGGDRDFNDLTVRVHRLTGTLHIP